MERLLTRREAAEALRLKENTLAVWLCRGRGPRLPVVKIGGRCLYRQEDVEEVITSHMIAARKKQV